jgi:cyanophycinase
MSNSQSITRLSHYPITQLTRGRMRLAILLLAMFAMLSAWPTAQSPGALVVIGGGTIDPAIVTRTMELAGGNSAVVAVLPQASAAATAGDSGVAMWLKAGAREARKVDFADRAAARNAIERATLIWIPGGQQSRFMDAIAGTGLDEVIRARRNAGAIVAGTSAGAAVMSTVMITGDADLKNVKAGGTVTRQALGLWPDAIVDQHFLQRQRNNRLIAAVLDRPDLVGVGIDEATAVVVQGSRMEVVGRSGVIVIDGRRAKVSDTDKGAVSAGTGLTMHVLRSGMTLDLR